MSTETGRRIAIIGGGITGLSLAYYLSKSPNRKNSTITLFDPSAQLGGMIKSEKTPEGFTLECGPNVVVFKKDLNELIENLSLLPIFPRQYRQQVYFNGGLHDVPKSPVKFIKTALLSTSTKLNCIWSLLRKPFNKTSTTQSIAEFFSAFGDEVVWRLIDPAIQGIYGGDIKKLRAKSIFPELWKAVAEGESLLGYLRSKPKGPKSSRMMGTLAGGLKTLCEALVREIGVNIQERGEVTQITKTPEGKFIVQYNGEGAIGSSQEFDELCIATNAKTLANCLRDFPSLTAAAGKVRSVPLSVLHMEVSADSLMQKDSFGALWPSTAKTDFKGVLQNSELFPHTAPAGKILITSMIGGEFGQVASIEDLLELCKKSLAPFNIKPVRALKVTRWPNAIPQYDDVHAVFLEELKNVSSTTAGFHFLGAEVGGVGIADRVAIAKKISERILGT